MDMSCDMRVDKSVISHCFHHEYITHLSTFNCFLLGNFICILVIYSCFTVIMGKSNIAEG